MKDDHDPFAELAAILDRPPHPELHRRRLLRATGRALDWAQAAAGFVAGTFTVLLACRLLGFL